MANYWQLSEELQDRIRQDRKQHRENPFAFHDEKAQRRNRNHDRPLLWRPVFVSDTEKIIHNTYYNRYNDKTQVFSLYQNDDITRRGLHVQLVARIARNIGSMLGLNNDLIEAIALGHDIGHTPFGHDGERILNDLLQEHTGRFFHHNVHSVRILDTLIQRNITLQTLDGVLCHNGEMEQQEYRPRPLQDFAEFDRRVEACYMQEKASRELVPSTLEACVMRVCDIIAYLGKDRQDAQRIGLLSEQDERFTDLAIGNTNAEIINNLTVNIVENSYGKDYLSMSPECYEALQIGKRENGRLIYADPEMTAVYQEQIRPMFYAVYEALLQQAREMKTNSVLYRHHIAYLFEANRYISYFEKERYLQEEPNQIVVDFMASMTDDYLIQLYQYLFPKGTCKVEYIGYFQDMES